MDPFPQQDLSRSPAPNRLSKQERSWGTLLVPFPALTNDRVIKQATSKKIICCILQLICNSFDLFAYSLYPHVWRIDCS